MAGNTILILLAALALISFDLAQAQPKAKVVKIGWLSTRPVSRSGGGSDVIRRELREVGYAEGKNIVFENRSTEGKLDRLPALAADLVDLKADVLLAYSTPAARALKNATETIPIVFVSSGDPVAAGLVDSLARPGGNITGFSTISSVIVGKRLELLKETIPKLARVAVLWSRQGSTLQWKESQLPAQKLGLQLHSMEVSSPDKYEKAFEEAIKAGSEALVVGGSALDNANQKLIVDLAAKYRLPAVCPRADYIANGGLMSYGADRDEPYKRAASMIDKILKGAKPTDIPVEQPRKFELTINLKAAKQIGLTISPNVLARADKVIK
jgi:putative tryptophan/tyrosine transport system substrate-binding protein